MADMPDYESLSRAELMKLRTDLDRAISTVGDRDRRAALKAAEAAARAHGYSLAELAPLIGEGTGRGRRGSGTSGGAAKGAAEVRFRNPDNADQTWSGRGRRPAWYSEALAAGRPVEDLKAG